MNHLPNQKHRGDILLLVLVYGAIFFGILAAICGFVIIENRADQLRGQKNETFTIAEAGLDYYRWFLSHYPGDTQNGTGEDGPYAIPYADPEGGTTGTYTLSVLGHTSCGITNSVEVTSVGTATDAPGVRSTLWARYAEPSVAQYSFILNSSVWIDENVLGPLHSNGGIRMDGTSTAPVTSSVSTWTCNSSFGCGGSQTKPGVFGAGPNQNLWSYPTPQMDFAGIAADFTSLKTKAQATGLYYSRVSTGTSGVNAHKGYHLIFNSDGTVTVKQVTSVSTTLKSGALDIGNGAQVVDYTLITGETTLGTYPVPADCGLIFVEDNLWIEGTITSKVTVVDAVLSPTGIYPDAVITNNLLYSAYDGSAGLTLISSHDVLMGPTVPDTLTLNGILVAQTGAFGRNLYLCTTPYEQKSSFTLLGTVVSSLRPVTLWYYSASGCTNRESGFLSDTISFDRQNSTNPPPFTPVTSTQYQFVDWREQ